MRYLGRNWGRNDHVSQGSQHFLQGAHCHVGLGQALLGSSVRRRNPPGQLQLHQPVWVALVAVPSEQSANASAHSREASSQGCLMIMLYMYLSGVLDAALTCELT